MYEGNKNGCREAKEKSLGWGGFTHGELQRHCKVDGADRSTLGLSQQLWLICNSVDTTNAQSRRKSQAIFMERDGRVTRPQVREIIEPPVPMDASLFILTVCEPCFAASFALKSSSTFISVLC